MIKYRAKETAAMSLRGAKRRNNPRSNLRGAQFLYALFYHILEIGSIEIEEKFLNKGATI
jgi:hypothetical protein